MDRSWLSLLESTGVYYFRKFIRAGSGDHFEVAA
jgi:hypothetical protein